MDFNGDLFTTFLILFETVVFIVFINNALDQRVRVKLLPLTLVLACFQLSIRICFRNMGFISIVPTVILDLLMIAISFKGKLSKKIFLICVFYAFSIILDTVAIITTSLFCLIANKTVENMDLLVVSSSILSKILLVSAVFLLSNLLNTDSQLIVWAKYLPAPMLTVAAIMRISIFLMDIDSLDKVILIISVCAFSLLCNIFLVISIHKSNEQIQLKYKLDMQKQSNEMSKKHYIELLEAYKEIERLAHDMKHHLNYLEGAATLDAMKSYIEKLKKRSFSKVETLTGNFDIDMILTAKKSEASEKGLILEVNKIILPAMDWLDPVDIVTILGNSITNAVEACEQCGDKINIKFQHNDNFLLISVQNPTTKQSIEKVKRVGLISTKPGGHRGIGLESIAASVNAYDGFMKYEVKNGIFRLDILLQRSPADETN